VTALLNGRRRKAAGCTLRLRAFPLSSSLEPGPPARIVETGMEGRRNGFPYRHNSGRGLPTHRSPGRLHPGIADYGSCLSSHSLRSVSRPYQSHRESGIRRQTFCETTLDPISSVTLGLVTVFDFLA